MGAGLRFQLSRSFSLFGEGRVLYATFPITRSEQGWSSFDMGDRTRGELVFGLSYLFHCTSRSRSLGATQAGGFASSASICCRSASSRPGEKRLTRGRMSVVPK